MFVQNKRNTIFLQPRKKSEILQHVDLESPKSKKKTLLDMELLD